MKLSYFRKSNNSYKQTIESLKSGLKAEKFEILGEIELKESENILILAVLSESVAKILEVNRELIGILPINFNIYSKNGEVFVGTGDPSILGGLVQIDEVRNLSLELEKKYKKIINEAAGVGELKPSKVTLYSTMSCPYCKMEQSWMDKNNIEYEVVYVDINQVKARELVEKTGQMGVPVTEVGFEDGESEYIVGFDQIGLQKMLIPSMQKKL